MSSSPALRLVLGTPQMDRLYVSTLDELIHCHSSVNYFLCMPFFLWKCHVSGRSLCLIFFFPIVSVIWERLFNWIIRGFFCWWCLFCWVFLRESFPTGWKLRGSRSPNAYLLLCGLRVSSSGFWQGKQSALHFSMLRCGNDFTVPHTVVGNIRRIQWLCLIHIFFSFLVPVLSLGLRTPDFSAPQAGERA